MKNTKTGSIKFFALAFSAASVVGFTSSPTIAQDETNILDTVVVSANRAEQSLSDVPRSITIIEADEIERALNKGRDVNDVFAKLIPGMGTSLHGDLNNRTQNQIRGRRVLVLINGVSQNNGFLDFGQEYGAIDPYNIERVEVIRGGSAVYGLGAQGGIINVITKKPKQGDVEYKSDVSLDFQQADSDSLSWDVSQQFQAGSEKHQWRFGLGYGQRGNSFDADDNRRPSYFNEDDMDNLTASGAYNYDISDERSISAHLNFRRISDLDGYCATNGNARKGVVAKAIHCGAGLNNGLVGTVDDLGKPASGNPLIRNRMNLQLNYKDDTIPFGDLDTTLYWMSANNETAQLRFRDRLNGNRRIFGHNEEDFDRYGIKTNMSSSIPFADVVWGVDVENQTFAQPNNVGLINNTPDVEQFAIAGFGQFTSDLTDFLTLSYGARFEHTELSVDTFQVGSTFANAGQTVTGGDESFEEILPNFGFTLDPIDGVQIFGSYARGFSVNEALRDIRDGDSDTVSGAAQPIVTDNYEIGVRGTALNVDYSAAYFRSRSDLGQSLSLNSSGSALESVRAPERIWGVEATLGFNIIPSLRFDSTLSFQEGERRLREDGAFEPLDGRRISPIKVTSSLEYDSEDWGIYTLDLLYSGSRNKSDEITKGAAGKIDSFFLLDAGAEIDVGPGKFNIGISNLLNKKYLTPEAQGDLSNNTYFYAPGRRFYLGYSIIF